MKDLFAKNEVNTYDFYKQLSSKLSAKGYLQIGEFSTCNFSFHANGLFLCPPPHQTSQNLWFSDVVRGYRERPAAWNGLKLKIFWK